MPDLAPTLDETARWIASLGLWAYPAFIALFALGTVLAIPATLLLALGALLFGLWGGFWTGAVGATLGATLAFCLARGAGRPNVEARLAKHPRWRRIDADLGRHGAIAVLLLRLLPILPFTVLNYVCGLSSIRLRDYVGATAFGILPGAFVYVYAAATLKDSGDPGFSWSRWVLPAVLLALFLIALPLAVRAADRRSGGRLLSLLARRFSRGRVEGIVREP
ncbi:MAG TPA: TVP38/TMEM64 family protein [Thermoanaerobaculia bacterium]|nr:TVP38/TMEM64 family protein [Thermoanaerobaculia bacterium]